MPAIVVPFSGVSGKQRLEPIAGAERGELALAMLADVVAACVAVGGPVVVATPDETAASLAPELGAVAVTDVPPGQGPAVGVAIASLDATGVLVVNADLPCATPRDLLTVLGAMPADGMALVRAADGTTNVVALGSPRLFAPLYGEQSARRFREHAARLGADVAFVDVPNLSDDVDTPADLERVSERLGPRTRAAVAALALAPAG